MLKNLFGMILAGFFLFGAGFCITVRAEDCRSIIVTSDPDYPPISWRDNENPDKIIGVAVEIIEQAFAGTGIQVEAKYAGPWKRALLSVLGGEVDLIVGLYENQKRKADMDYVYPPFMEEPVSVFVITGDAFGFEQWTDLKGKVGGVRAGDSFGTAFDGFARQHLNLEPVGEFEQLYKMASAGRIAYFLYGYYSGLALTEKMGINENIEILKHPVVMESLYVAFSRDSECRIHKVFLSEKIQEFVAEGLVDDLIRKYQDIWEAQVEKALMSRVGTGANETIHHDLQDIP
jgi:polar amino acid transport system substrate-binding protein